jgi:hypothetical protein
MNLSKRERVLIIGSAIILIIVIFLYYYYFPLKKEIENMETQLQEVLLQVEDGQRKKELVNDLQEELNNLQLAQSESKEYLISSLDEPEIISYISRIIGNQGELKSLSFSGVTDREIYVSGDLGLKFETNYNELKKIIEKFENGEYFTTLNNVRIDKKEKEESSNEETNEEREKTNKNTLDVDCGIRFYAKEANWDGTGDYIFMEGEFSKSNIFE